MTGRNVGTGELPLSANVVRRCAAIVALVRSGYADSRQCRRELYVADSHNLRVVPVMMEGHKLGNSGVRYALAGIEALALNEELDVGSAVNLERSVSTVVDAIRRDFRSKGIPCPGRAKKLVRHSKSGMQPPKGIVPVRSGGDASSDEDAFCMIQSDAESDDSMASLKGVI